MKINRRGLVSTMLGVAGISAMLGSSLILAQESAREVANIPFAFHARETTLPAGRYTICAMNSQGAMRISDKKTGHSIMVPTRGRQSGPDQTARLTFHRYGNEYFLSEIWMPQQVDGYTVGKSAREKELSKQPDQLALASVRLQGE